MAAAVEHIFMTSLTIGSFDMPVLMVQLSNANEITNSHQMRSLWVDEIYPRLGGCVCSAGAYYYKYQFPNWRNEVLQFYTGGSFTHGDDNGFKVATTFQNDTYNIKSQFTKLSYKGKAIGFFSVPVITAAICYAVIFVDENYNVYQVSGSTIGTDPTAKSYSAVTSRANNLYVWPGWTAGDLGPIAYIGENQSGDWPAYTNYTSTPFRLDPFTGNDISDDISRPQPVSEYDPYFGGGDSGPGGGGGTFDYDGLPPGGADDFTTPDISAVDAGFITLYNPTTAELNQLASYLWSSSFDLNTFKKLFNDPMDLFLGLSIVPVAIPDGGRQNVGIGLIDTGIAMTVASDQWVSVSCGSVFMTLLTGSYLDFDPYTQVEIYLPYIGVRTLKADDVMGKTLTVTYWVDILSGACVAWLDVDGSVMYQFMGQCATSIPVVSGDWTNLINGILGVVGGAVGGAVKGGVGGAIAGGVAAASSVAVNDGKISVERSGAISSAGGMIAHQKPYLIISSPRICKPKAQNTFEGYPAYYTSKINDLSGYTEIETMHLSGIFGLDDELSEIKSLLLGGVIL